MFVPLLIGAAAFGAWRWSRNRKPGVWTPERAALYATAMRYERDPAKLAHWADFFAKEGFPDKANALRARIQIPKVHGEGRSQRAAIARRAFGSENAEAVRAVAARYEGLGCGATADLLHRHARGLEVAAQVPPWAGPTAIPPWAGLAPYAAPPPPPPPPLPGSIRHAAFKADRALGGLPWYRGASVDGATLILHVTEDTDDVRAQAPEEVDGFAVALRAIDLSQDNPNPPPPES